MGFKFPWEKGGGGNPLSGAADEIKRGLNKIGDEIKRDVRNVGNEAKRGVEDAAKGAKRQVEGVADKAKGEVQTVANKAKDEIKDEVGKVGDEVRKHVPQVLEEAAEEIEKAAEEAVKAVIRAIQDGTLNKAIDILQVAAPASANLKLGPVSFAIANINDRIDEVQHWAGTGIPTSANGVKNIIQVLGPTSCTVDLTAYVVTPLGLEMTWETQEFLKRLDDIWARI